MSLNQSIAKIISANMRLMYKPKIDNCIIGTVKNTDPLEIEIQQGVILTEAHLRLGEALRPHNVSMPHIHEYNGETEKGKAIAPNGDLTLIGNGKLEEPTGHSHDISGQRTEDVHKIQNKNEKYVTITMYPPLHASDKVLMFAFNDNQMYYVAERLEIGSENTDYDA